MSTPARSKRAATADTPEPAQNLTRSLTERDISVIWNAQSLPDRPLSCRDGRSVQVVYRGRWSYGFGPDFGGAMVALGGRLTRGDVEIHLRSGGWQAHGHADDPRYNAVVLHVVAQRAGDVSNSVTRADGVAIPTLALDDFFTNGELLLALKRAEAQGTRLGTLSESGGPCCDRVAQLNPSLESVIGRIEDVGLKRFTDRAARFESDFAQGGADQALWARLLEALGYSQNKEPFLRLAAMLPYRSAAALARGRLDVARGTWRPASDDFRDVAHERAMTLESVLLGVAGLLPSQRAPRKGKSKATRLHAQEGNVGYDLEWLAEEYAPSPRADWVAARYAEELERRWEASRRTLDMLGALRWGAGAMAEKEWAFARLRPTNYPTRRIAGAARLLVRLLDMVDARNPVPPDGGQTPGLAWLVSNTLMVGEEESPRDAPPTMAALKSVRSLFELSVAAAKPADDSVDDEGGAFWAGRFDFGRKLNDDSDIAKARAKAAKAAKTIKPTRVQNQVELIGTARANDIVLNVALPFAHALGLDSRDTDLAEIALALYTAHPPLASNELIETMARQVFGGFYENAHDAKPKKRPYLAHVTSAQRQQGLIGLHHNFCAEQNCGACPLSGG